LAFAAGDWLGGVGRQQLRVLLNLVTLLLAVPVLFLASRHAGALGAAAAYSALTAVIAFATAVASRRYLSR
jgi:O-antigen/teichoic acid export membrane protein